MNETSSEIRPAPWWLFVLLLAVTLLMTVLGNQWYLPSGIWKPINEQSHGFLNPTLIFGVAFFAIVICGVMLGIGRRTAREVGLDRTKFPAGALYTCLLWIAVQFVLIGCYVALDRSVTVANGWTDIGILNKSGRLLAQLLGNALCEETLYRGFLLMQCVLLFRTLWPHRPRMALLVAFGVASSIFALSHLPFDLRADRFESLSKLVWDQAGHLLSGCLFGWIFWQTGNLFFTVGVHALSNEPTTLFAWHDLGPLTRTDPVVLLIAVGIAAAWKRLPGTQRKSTC